MRRMRQDAGLTQAQLAAPRGPPVATWWRQLLVPASAGPLAARGRDRRRRSWGRVRRSGLVLAREAFGLGAGVPQRAATRELRARVDWHAQPRRRRRELVSRLDHRERGASGRVRRSGCGHAGAAVDARRLRRDPRQRRAAGAAGDPSRGSARAVEVGHRQRRFARATRWRRRASRQAELAALAVGELARAAGRSSAGPRRVRR